MFTFGELCISVKGFYVVEFCIEYYMYVCICTCNRLCIRFLSSVRSYYHLLGNL